MGGRRSQARPRWLESAKYPGRCGECGAQTKVGDRILHRPARPILCAGCGTTFLERQTAERKRERETAVAEGLRVRAVYEGSDGALTRRLCTELLKLGPAGRVAWLLFRAQKASRRAKKYGRTSYRGLAYARKGESLRELSATLSSSAIALGISYGWGRDEGCENPWVLYVELPGFGQVSFHSPERYDGPDHPEGWDGHRASEERIINFCQQVLESKGSHGNGGCQADENIQLQGRPLGQE